MTDTALPAWFLGPKAENSQLLQAILSGFLSKPLLTNDAWNIGIHGVASTDRAEKFNSDSLENASIHVPYSQHHLLTRLDKLLGALRQGTIPFFSPRYQGHTIPDPTISSLLGAFAGALCDVQARDAGNPGGTVRDGKNEDASAKFLENEIDIQLCRMMGLQGDGDDGGPTRGWAHLTKSGTSANMEALWTAYTAKVFPLLLYHLIAPGQPLAFLAPHLRIANHRQLITEKCTLVADADPWTLANLPLGEILSLRDRLQSEFNISPKYLARSILQTGLTPSELYSKYGFSPKCTTPSTAHYSWPKTASALGLGSNALISVRVGEFGRMRMDALESVLEDQLASRQPVFSVVLMVGATPEGAVDYIDQVLEMRERFCERGMWFAVHVDAAYGGYFTSMVRVPTEIECSGSRPKPDPEAIRPLVARNHTLVQLKRMKDVDSITVDPHKSGYCPYPSGGIVHKDRRIRALLRPFLGGRDFTEPASMTSLASVFLSHRVLGLHNEGHGYLLNDLCWTSARCSAYLHTLSSSSTTFRIVPFSILPSKIIENPKTTRETPVIEFIRRRIVGRTTEELASDSDPRIQETLSSLGGDLPINVFACNVLLQAPSPMFSTSSTHLSDNVETPGGVRIESVLSTTPNRNVQLANKFNRRIYERFSMTSVDASVDDVSLFLTSTTFKSEDYGDALRGFKERLGLWDGDNDGSENLGFGREHGGHGGGESLVVLRQSVMSPFLRDEDLMRRCFTKLVDIVGEEAERILKEVESERAKVMCHQVYM